MKRKLIRAWDKARTLVGEAIPALEKEGGFDLPPAKKLPPIDFSQQHRLRQRLHFLQSADHYYFIDVVGTCNLRCPSCPVGNSMTEASKGFMSLERLHEILAKIVKDRPAGEKVFVDLYNWGEPTLHPNLAGCIDAVHKHGFGCGISSNLNVFPNMREVIKAAPEYIRISLSGFSNENYRMTHRGGDVNAVKGNMHLLRHWLDRYRSQSIVQVGFHVYRSNFPGDFLKMRELCDQLGFIFAPVIATMMPAEKAVAAAGGVIEPGDVAVNEKFVIPLERWSAIYREDGVHENDCQYRKSRTTINFDGSVSLCCAVYDSDKTIAKSFLDIDDTALGKSKYGHSFCDSCMSRDMHQMYTGVPAPSLEKEAIRVLGPLYAEFLAAERVLGDSRSVQWNGRFWSAQEIYDKAMGVWKKGDSRTAAKILGALIEQFPVFGEGFLQSARLAELHGDRPRAIALIEEAVRLAPTHAPYSEEMQRLKRLEALAQ